MNIPAIIKRFLKISSLILVLCFVLMRLFLVKGSIIFWRPSFTLTIKDIKTHEPIAGGLVKLKWTKGWEGSYGGVDVKEQVIMTDREGKIKAPWIFDVFVFYAFDLLAIDIYHPLYKHELTFGDEGQYPVILKDRIIEEKNCSYIDKSNVLCEMESLKDIFSETRCIVDDFSPNDKETCVGRNRDLYGLFSDSRHYFWVKDETRNIRNYHPELFIDRNKAADELEKIGALVYEKSLKKPSWISNLTFIRKRD